MSQLLKPRQAAAYVGLSATSFRRAVKAGHILPAEEHPFGGLKFDTVDLDLYRKACRERALERRLRATGTTPGKRVGKKAHGALVERARLEALAELEAR